ncbi:hypothetical protein BaRGS_00004000 [Batillaria attramentaria]|uniref:Uncharacterized protein n=1 Tax=Batillaria attramentaria TaxID=370345 RepID=A0ABD0M179_9CAEN
MTDDVHVVVSALLQREISCKTKCLHEIARRVSPKPINGDADHFLKVPKTLPGNSFEETLSYICAPEGHDLNCSFWSSFLGGGGTNLATEEHLRRWSSRHRMGSPRTCSSETVLAAGAHLRTLVVTPTYGVTRFSHQVFLGQPQRTEKKGSHYANF